MANPLVDQPTTTPSRKLQAVGYAGGTGAAVAFVVVEALHQVPGLAFLSEGGWQAVTYLIMVAVPAVSAFVAGYRTRERASANAR